MYAAMIAALASVALVACGGGTPMPYPSRVPRAASCLVAGESPCVSATPVSVRDGVVAWGEWLHAFGEAHGSKFALGVMECRWIEEIDGVLLCGSNDTAAMHHLFGRASVFVEGFGEPSGNIVSHAKRARLTRTFAGHDLPRDHPERDHPDLEAFYAAAEAACAESPALCLDAQERALQELLVDAWAGRSAFVVISFAADSVLSVETVICHEVFLAQYLIDPVYRDAVDQYWRAMSPRHQRAIRRRLAPLYDPRDEFLVTNEFQAYTLEGTAPLGWIPTHRGPLVRQLRARGVAPIACQRSR